MSLLSRLPPYALHEHAPLLLLLPAHFTKLLAAQSASPEAPLPSVDPTPTAAATLRAEPTDPAKPNKASAAGATCGSAGGGVAAAGQTWCLSGTAASTNLGSSSCSSADSSLWHSYEQRRAWDGQRLQTSHQAEAARAMRSEQHAWAWAGAAPPVQ
jgi:hypothetical protein